MTRVPAAVTVMCRLAHINGSTSACDCTRLWLPWLSCHVTPSYKLVTWKAPAWPAVCGGLAANLTATEQLRSLSLEAAHAAGVPTVVARRTLQAGNNLIGRLVPSADEAIKAAVEGAGLIVLQVSPTHVAVQAGGAK